MELWVRQGMAYRCQTSGPMPFPVPGWMWDRELGRDLYKRRMRYIRGVDQLGYDGIIFTEHHYGPNGGLTPSPHITVAAASQVTLMPTKEEALKHAERLYIREREEAYEPVFEPRQLDELGRGRYTPRSYEYLAEDGDTEKFIQDNYMRLRRELVGRDFEELKKNGQYIVGDAEMAAEQMMRQLERCDANVMIVQPEQGTRPLEDILLNWSIFAEKARGDFIRFYEWNGFWYVVGGVAGAVVLTVVVGASVGAYQQQTVNNSVVLFGGQ